MLFKKTAIVYITLFFIHKYTADLPYCRDSRSSSEHINNYIEEIKRSGLLNQCTIAIGPPMLKMYHSVLMRWMYWSLQGNSFHRFFTNLGSSEVRVSDRAAPLQLTWIQGLAREHFSRADACQHGHLVSGSSSENIVYLTSRSGVSKLRILTCPWESPAKWSCRSLMSHLAYFISKKFSHMYCIHKLTDRCFILSPKNFFFFPPHLSIIILSAGLSETQSL